MMTDADKVKVLIEKLFGGVWPRVHVPHADGYGFFECGFCGLEFPEELDPRWAGPCTEAPFDPFESIADAFACVDRLLLEPFNVQISCRGFHEEPRTWSASMYFGQDRQMVSATGGVATPARAITEAIYLAMTVPPREVEP